MVDHLFKAKVTESEVFKSFPSFKQDIYINRKVLARLLDYYGQAQRLGLDYIKQNPNLTLSDINLIKSIL